MSLNTKVIEALQMYHNLMRESQGISTIPKYVYGTSMVAPQHTQVRVYMWLLGTDHELILGDWLRNVDILYYCGSMYVLI